VNKLTKNTLSGIEKQLQDIQNILAKDLCDLNSIAPIKKSENWERKLGGGGKSISISGNNIEKAAVNFSSISGKNLPKSSVALKSTAKNSTRFHAIGVSVISHPQNPFSPTGHMNIRIFIEINSKNEIVNWWTGGGFDLTPFYPMLKEAKAWHQNAKQMLDQYNKSYHSKFAKMCDEYFILPHRQEHRGIGGIFFDQLQHKELQDSIDLLTDIALCFTNSYKSIVNNTKQKQHSKGDKDYQLYRRGRYVEFNLLFDRGTKFGIESNGRADSILASLPPEVRWPSIKTAGIKKREKKLLHFFHKRWKEYL